MAKIAELKFTLFEQKHKIPVNVGVDGVFKTKLPKEVADPLGIRQELKADKLSDLEHEFFAALDKFKTAKTFQYLYLAIRYGSCGVYNRTEEGYSLFHETGSKYKVDNWNSDVDSIAFEYRVVIMESVAGVEKWYSTMELTPGKYEKHTSFYNNSDKWKLIPYTEVCHQTLKKAEESLRKISEMLFKFIDQDEQQIILSLSGNTLLLN
jgi:hypothetical protein